jgi:hypothetical protein
MPAAHYADAIFIAIFIDFTPPRPTAYGCRHYDAA